MIIACQIQKQLVNTHINSINTYAGKMMPKTLVIKGVLTKKDKELFDYKYIPFSVPLGVNTIEVNYSYDGRSWEDPNIVDIGIFGSNGIDFLKTNSFRGWSGGKRSKFFISSDRATPGYIPGRIKPGVFHIILGLVKISSKGCNYIVEITLHKHRVSRASPPEMAMPLSVKSRGERWYKGDLHVHTNHSDNRYSLANVVKKSLERGLDFISITDHNTISQNFHLGKFNKRRLLVIPGEEITTYYGHANVWGVQDWIDFRCRTSAEMEKIINGVHREKLLFSLNHPFEEEKERWWLKKIENFDCIEVWNEQADYRAVVWWDSLLQSGKRVTAVGGSDFHGTENQRIGCPTNWVYSKELSVRGILGSVRSGHLFISRDRRGPQVFLTADPNMDGAYECMVGDRVTISKNSRLRLKVRVLRGKGGLLRVISKRGLIEVREVTATNFTLSLNVRPSSDTYYRVEVVRQMKSKAEAMGRTIVDALTNPIFVKVCSS